VPDAFSKQRQSFENANIKKGMQFNILYEVPLASTVVAQKQKVFTGFTLSKEQQEFML